MQSSPAFSRNIDPIADAMAAQGFDRCEFLLELGCGPGEHVVEFAKRWEEPFFQPTDCSRAAITSTDLRAKEATGGCRGRWDKHTPLWGVDGRGRRSSDIDPNP